MKPEVQSPMPECILLMGPTATGKTQAAIELAKQLPVSIISVDSAMVYRGMNIGTGKPEPEVLSQYPHALVDICEPNESFSVAAFRERAFEIVQHSWAAGKVPVLVGGTMLYFHGFMEGLSEIPRTLPETRKKIRQSVSEHGIAALYAYLEQIDPETARRLHPNDTQRIMRAVEVYEQSGQTLSHFQGQRSDRTCPFKCHRIVWSVPNRERLHQRISERFYAMMASGFVEEVARLKAIEGMHDDFPAIRSVGYRQIWQYLAGQCKLEEVYDKAIVATRQLAKRQLTWLRRLSTVEQWLDSESASAQQHLCKVGTIVAERLDRGD
jgi:tRNA dimethylallyltransferase